MFNFGNQGGGGMGMGMGFGQGRPFTLPNSNMVVPSTPVVTSVPFSISSVPVVVPDVIQEITSLANGLDVNSAYCQLKHMFYNQVDEKEIGRYVKPGNVDEGLWQQAIADNPDPSRLVPVQATGWDDVMKRIQIQEEMARLHSLKVDEMEKTVQGWLKRHELETELKIEQLKKKGMEMVQHILHCMRQLEMIKTKNMSLTPQEEAFRIQLEALQKEFDRPAQFKTKLNDLLQQLQFLKRSSRHRCTVSTGGSNNDSGESYEIMNQEALKNVHKVLEEQQKGLIYLTDLVRESSRDFEIMAKGYSEQLREPAKAHH